MTSSPDLQTPLDEAEIALAARARELAHGYREAARRALGFARLYRADEGAPGGEREKACIVQAQEWRRVARDLRAGRLAPGLAPAVPQGPGLARARHDSAPDSQRRSTG